METKTIILNDVQNLIIQYQNSANKLGGKYAIELKKLKLLHAKIRNAEFCNDKINAMQNAMKMARAELCISLSALNKKFEKSILEMPPYFCKYGC